MSHEAPTVPFAAVASAQELELLAEVSAASGNASDIARRILRRLPAEGGRRSYAYENGFSFHFLTEGRLIFLCMERGVPPPKAFAFLAESALSQLAAALGLPKGRYPAAAMWVGIWPFCVGGGLFLERRAYRAAWDRGVRV